MQQVALHMNHNSGNMDRAGCVLHCGLILAIVFLVVVGGGLGHNFTRSCWIV
jgi:hypothetical protein